MRTSESITELAEALAHAQDELENAPRDERNPHFGSEYASLSSATNTIRPAFTGDRNAYCLGLTESLLDQKKIPTLPEHEYQEWAEYLFHAPLHLQVAETLFRHDRQHPHALGLFLACVYPIAQRSADRVMVLSGISRKDLTQELMFNGAINEVIHFFRADQLGEDTDFRAALYLTLKVGALNAIFWVLVLMPNHPATIMQTKTTLPDEVRTIAQQSFIETILFVPLVLMQRNLYWTSKSSLPWMSLNIRNGQSTLFEAPKPLRLEVAETLFRYDRQHPRALPLFLACVYPIAKRSVDRVMAR